MQHNRSVEANGTFLGGNIAPGMKMRWKAMHEFTREAAFSGICKVGDQILGQRYHISPQTWCLKGNITRNTGYFTELHSNIVF
ncbi:MAG: hypothetical protein IPI30_22370 [Saprospiraceae bacterium]|nr:hypothetical protein [Candidatus Vicinibacter affinis]